MSLESRVVAALRERSLVLGCAESCTGGLFAERVTRIAGASEAFAGGVVAYTEDAKADVLGVGRGLLAREGAVSRETTLAMAHAARRLLRCDVGVAISGYAGPTGDVGRAFVALADARGDEAHELRFSGTREAIRDGAATAALEALLERVLRS